MKLQEKGVSSNCYIRLNKAVIAWATRVYSWILTPPPLHYECAARSILCMPVFLRHIFELLTVSTTCDFERGGAKQPIIGSS